MADLGMLFTLTLVALTFVVVGVCFIVYIMIIGERKKQRQASRLMPDEQLYEGCPHHFGYLSGYAADHLVPEECYGCAKTIQCAKSQAAMTLIRKPAEF